MNAKTRKFMALVAVLTVCLFSVGQPISAQSLNGRGWLGQRGNSAQSKSAPSPNSNCRQVKGKLMDLSTLNGVVGTLTNGGTLNGTYELLNHAGPLSTPDPNTISYTLDFVLTTNQGQLKSSDVGIFDFETGVFSEIARINPSTSTGRFAGATGVLFTSGKTTDGGATFQSEITGEICFANE